MEIIILRRRILIMETDNEIRVDEAKVDALTKKIIVMENMNLKIHNKSDSQMISDIQKAIEEAVQCYSNQ